jgi:hypothetical protein
MINFFDTLYTSINNKFRLLTKIRFYSMLRFIVRFTANISLPIYFNLSGKNGRYSLKGCNKTNNRIIVSLTSFPVRINNIWLVIESLLHQTQKPDKIILWLSQIQFNSLQILPKNLLKLQKRGLEIRLCEGDLRSHKKYYYAMQEFKNDIIITVDDDVFYNSNIIEHLITLNKKYPNSVCCNHCCKIEVSNDQIMPYIMWKNHEHGECADYDIFPIGVGGILYPPNVLDPLVFDMKVFEDLCLLGDDIWLNSMMKLAGNFAVKSGFKSNYIPIMNFNNITLNEENINEGLNDIQLNAVRELLIKIKGFDIFQEILTNNKRISK